MNITLYTTYYEEPRSARRAELDLCIQVNDAVFPSTFLIAENCEKPPFAVSNGFSMIAGPRPTISSLCIAARTSAKQDDISIVANADVIFTADALWQISQSLRSNQVYCLTRHEISRGMALWDVEYSQDTWVFRGPPRANIGGDYHFGVPGCDNRFAYELQQAGYEVLNPSRDIRTWHLHGSRLRTEMNTEAHRVPPPYLYVRPHRLGERPQTKIALDWQARQHVVRERRGACAHK